MAATALSVAPVRTLMRPDPAYAQVCGCSGSSCSCGSLCCDGYTEFCCTITGANSCPPGAVLGGWWKVEGHSRCGGSARYYMDCHRTCGTCGCGSSGLCTGGCANTSCGCANGSCGPTAPNGGPPPAPAVPREMPTGVVSEEPAMLPPAAAHPTGIRR